MKHPKRKILRLKAEVRDLKFVRDNLRRIVYDTRRELDQLDGEPYNRGDWTPAHRVRVYRMTQQLQPKANELGKVVTFVCAPGFRVRWDQSEADVRTETHTHSVHPDKPEREQVDVSTLADLARGERKFMPGALKI